MTEPRSQPPESSRPPETESPGIVDWPALRDHLGFALRAVRRRPFVATLCFLAVAALGPLSLVVMPKTYRLEAIFTAARNPVVSTLTYPVLQRSFESDDAAQAAHDAIMRRDNLEALCEETGLLERFEQTRAPLGRLVDRIQAAVTGRERTREERIVALVERLEKRLTIEVPGAQPGASALAPRDRVAMTIDWPDAETGKLLLETAARRFFDGRRERERALVKDAVGVLEVRAASLQDEIGAQVKKVHELEVGLVRGNPALSRTYRAPRGRVPQEEALVRLRATLEAKKLAAHEIERFRDTRGEELREELARLRAGYSEQHPAVIRTRKLLEDVSTPPPQLSALRTDIVTLEQDLERASAIAARLVDDEDPALEYQRTELRLLLAQYTAIRERIDGARVESDASSAGFGHRYAFTVPPRIPREPIRPIPLLAIASGILGGLLFAVLCAAALDARSGRILERWQLERTLRLRVLGELRA
jgi:hypothetical protein